MNSRYCLFLYLLLGSFALSAQNVGINVDSPLFHLDVRAQSSSENTFLNIASQDNAYFTRLLAGHSGFPASSLSWTAGTPFNMGLWDGIDYHLVMHLNPQRRVGINTFNPEFTVDVRGLDDTFSGGELQLATPSQSNFLRFFGGRLGDPNPFIAFSDQDTFHIVTTSPDWSTYQRRLTMLHNGWTGLGVNNPQGRLHLALNSGTGSPQLRLTENEWDYARIKMENTAEPGTFWDIAGRADSVLADSKLNFYFFSPNGWGDRMTIRGNGDVGIGTTVPEAKLDIIGGDWNLEAGNPGDIRIGNSVNNLRIGVATGGGGAGVARIFTGGGVSEMIFGTSDTRRMAIKPDGKVGIGVDNPVELLHIGGTFRVDNLAGTGDRNVIVDNNGKFMIGTVGVGDTDWNETTNLVTTQKIARILTTTGTPPFSESTYLDITSGSINKWYQFGALSPSGVTLYLQDDNAGDLNLVEGGGQVGVGISPTGSKVTIEGPDNNGIVAGLEIHSSGSSQTLLIDGNEIDAATNLHINANSGQPVSIGTLAIANGYKLSVAGKVIAEEVRVQLQSSWPDYVFKENYQLLPLNELEEAIEINGHLPGIPAAAEIEANGLDVGDMQRSMMEKIEELTLYVIQLDQENNQLRERLKALEAIQPVNSPR